MEFTHLILWVLDNTISEKFYKKLGFEIVRSTDDESMVKLGYLKLELVRLRDEADFAKDSMSASKGQGVYICLRVTDVDLEFERLESLALNPSTPRNWPWGNREFVVKDPDNYKLVMWQSIRS